MRRVLAAVAALLVYAFPTTTSAAGISVFIGSPTIPFTDPFVCDQTVASSATLNSAVGTTASSGDTICVTADITGSRTWTVDQPAMVRVIAQPATRTLNMGSITFNGASNLTVEGFDLDGASIDLTTGSHDIGIVGNWIHDLSGDHAIHLNGASGAIADVDIIGNHIQHINFAVNGCQCGGYGVRTDVQADNVKVNYNTFDMAQSASDSEISGDSIEASLDGFEVIGNDIKNVYGSPYDGGDARNPHADGLMIWAGSSDGVIKDNRIINTTGTLISPDGQDILLENNLIVDATQQCMDTTQNGSSGNVVPLRFTWRRNTMEDCDNGGLHTNGSSVGARGQNVLDRNVLEILACEGAGPSQYTSADHNLVDSHNCSVTGTNNLNFTPTFQDTTNYLVTNLPGGYEDAGYRDAPAGYLEAP